MINIISGKISDFELNEKIHDTRPIKTTDDMNSFLLSLAIDLEATKERKMIEAKKRASEQEKLKKKFKKGFGSMLLMEINKKSREQDIFSLDGKINIKDYNRLFNNFLLSNNIQPRSKTATGSKTTASDRTTSNLMNKDFGTSNEMIGEIITDIDQKIDDKMKHLIEMTQGNPKALNQLVETMVGSKNPAQAKLAVFLSNYQNATQKLDKDWMKEQKQENINLNQPSVYGSPVRRSPTKSVSERFSPIKLRDY
jgi:recombination DNA repair RAD52 pathway protein